MLVIAWTPIRDLTILTRCKLILSSLAKPSDWMPIGVPSSETTYYQHATVRVLETCQSLKYRQLHARVFVTGVEVGAQSRLKLDRLRFAIQN